MNTGIQDAVALAWRLALAVKGMATDGLLESYDTERRPIGQEVVGRVRHARAGFETDDPETVLRREAQLLVAYPDSPLVGEGADAEALKGGPAPGWRAPDCRGLRRPAVAFPLRLHELLDGRRHTLLLYADNARQIAELAAVVALARDRAKGHVDARLVLAGDSEISDDIADGLLDGSPVPVVRDAAGEFRTACGAVGGCCYLIRPDGQVGFRAGQTRSEELASHLVKVFAA
jgi:hypothetical protein